MALALPYRSRGSIRTQSAESRAAGRYGDICLMAADGSEQRLLIRDGIMPRWSPAGDLVAFARSPIDFGDAWVARTDGTHVVHVPGGTPSWSPDADWLLVLTSPAGLVVNVVRPDGSDFRQLGQGWWNATWSPDGDRIAYAGGRQIVAIDIDDGSRELLFIAPTEQVGPLLWLPGDRLAYAANDGDLFLVDLVTGTSRALTDDLAVRGPLALSPGGDRIAFAAAPGRGISPDVYVASLTSGALTRLTHTGDASEPAWQPAAP